MAEVGPLGPRDAAFDALALEVFAYQFRHNAPFRAFCIHRARTPETVTHWRDVPPVPARAFKHLELVCGDPRSAEAVFETSGTREGPRRRGRHFVPSLALYRASALPNFRAHVLPDAGRARFISLTPSPADAPASSLSRMVGMAAEAFASACAWVVDGAGRLDSAGLAAALDAAHESGEPVLLLGTAFAFVHALDEPGVRLGPLPAGSRIMETGGFKGRAREVPREEFYEALATATGVEAGEIVNEYGMTELLSQMYARGGVGHVAPPWLAVRALDPDTLEEVPEGREGILCLYDLANAGSVAHVLTEDVGRLEGGRLTLLGRFPGSEPRGCSRAMDDLMERARR